VREDMVKKPKKPVGEVPQSSSSECLFCETRSFAVLDPERLVQPLGKPAHQHSVLVKNETIGAVFPLYMNRVRSGDSANQAGNGITQAGNQIKSTRPVSQRSRDQIWLCSRLMDSRRRSLLSPFLQFPD